MFGDIGNTLSCPGQGSLPRGREKISSWPHDRAVFHIDSHNPLVAVVDIENGIDFCWAHGDGFSSEGFANIEDFSFERNSRTDIDLSDGVTSGIFDRG